MDRDGATPQGIRRSLEGAVPKCRATGRTGPGGLNGEGRHGEQWLYNYIYIYLYYNIIHMLNRYYIHIKSNNIIYVYIYIYIVYGYIYIYIYKSEWYEHIYMFL